MLRLLVFGGLAAALPALVQIVYLGSTNSYGVLSAVFWGFFLVIGPCLLWGSILSLLGLGAWWLLRRFVPNWALVVRSGVVGVVVGLGGAFPIGTLLSSTELRLDPQWVVPTTGIYLALMLAGFVFCRERREAL